MWTGIKEIAEKKALLIWDFDRIWILLPNTTRRAINYLERLSSRNWLLAWRKPRLKGKEKEKNRETPQAERWWNWRKDWSMKKSINVKKRKWLAVSWLFFLFWSCVTDNLILKLSASVPVTYLVKIRIGDVFWESRNFELCFPSDLRFHFVRIKPLIQKLKRVIWCLWKRKFGSHKR